jgi:hypothetical protein
MNSFHTDYVRPHFPSLFQSSFSRFGIADSTEAVQVFAKFKLFLPDLNLSELHLILRHPLAAAVGRELHIKPSTYTPFSKTLCLHSSDPEVLPAIVTFAQVNPIDLDASLASPFAKLVEIALPRLPPHTIEDLIAFVQEKFDSTHFAFAYRLGSALFKCPAIVARLDSADESWCGLAIRALESAELEQFFECCRFLQTVRSAWGSAFDRALSAILDSSTEYLIKLSCHWEIWTAQSPAAAGKGLAAVLRRVEAGEAVFTALAEVFKQRRDPWGARFLQETVADRMVEYATQSYASDFLKQVARRMNETEAGSVASTLVQSDMEEKWVVLGYLFEAISVPRKAVLAIVHIERLPDAIGAIAEAQRIIFD